MQYVHRFLGEISLIFPSYSSHVLYICISRWIDKEATLHFKSPGNEVQANWYKANPRNLRLASFRLAFTYIRCFCFKNYHPFWKFWQRKDPTSQLAFHTSRWNSMDTGGIVYIRVSFSLFAQKWNFLTRFSFLYLAVEIICFVLENRIYISFRSVRTLNFVLFR